MRKITEEQYRAINKIIEFFDELSESTQARSIAEGAGYYFPQEQKIINLSLAGEDWAEEFIESCGHGCETCEFLESMKDE